MKIILVAIGVTVIFILYLFQHHYSINCTQEIAQLQKERQIRKDEVLRLEGEKTKVFLFSNLEGFAQSLNLTFNPNLKMIKNKNADDKQSISFVKDTVHHILKNE